ncbi:phage tail protein [Flavobacteriales bacterium 33_180_T64]|nr:phage tail protein [Flavobacteriales bacterium 33_180_T64]
MSTSNIKTPGVHIEESNAFPNSVVSVPTSIPAFIGYTPQALYDGESYNNKPTKVTSFADFQAIFCYQNPPVLEDPLKQYSPEYYLIKQKSKPQQGAMISINGNYYSILPDASTIYYLYNSVKMFYENGGRDAYIVSVGAYGKPSKESKTIGEQLVNPNVKLDDLLKGLALLKNEREPTMYICPEATLLSVENNGTLMQSMLLQNEEMQTAMSVFDVIGGNDPDPITFMDAINTFRSNTGSQGLSYGCVYYPFIGTSVMQSSDIDYTNFFGGDINLFEQLLNPTNDPNTTVAKILEDIKNPPDNPLTIVQYNNALIASSPMYSTIIKQVLMVINILPPSGAMAGVMTVSDNEKGVWAAPANKSIVGVTSLPIHLSDSQQGPLNVDAVSGKSINAIRFFNGVGFLIWGARTLDGNNSEWKYIPVRRTVTYIEQSCKLAIQPYTFASNDRNTWVAVNAIINNFLTELWRQGGIQGTKPSDAFFVQCGLGTTMTADDILEGILRVSIGVALIRPAEFVIITLTQQMATS